MVPLYRPTLVYFNFHLKKLTKTIEALLAKTPQALLGLNNPFMFQNVHGSMYVVFFRF